MNEFLNNNELIYTRNKSLNERDYGDLVGLNKSETAKIWQGSSSYMEEIL